MSAPYFQHPHQNGFYYSSIEHIFGKLNVSHTTQHEQLETASHLNKEKEILSEWHTEWIQHEGQLNFSPIKLSLLLETTSINVDHQDMIARYVPLIYYGGDEDEPQGRREQVAQWVEEFVDQIPQEEMEWTHDTTVGMQNQSGYMPSPTIPNSTIFDPPRIQQSRAIDQCGLRDNNLQRSTQARHPAVRYSYQDQMPYRSRNSAPRQGKAKAKIAKQPRRQHLGGPLQPGQNHNVNPAVAQNARPTHPYPQPSDKPSMLPNFGRKWQDIPLYRSAQGTSHSRDWNLTPRDYNG